MPIELFKNLTKRASDLLTKDFPSDKGERKFEWKGTADRVTIDSSITTTEDPKDGSTTSVGVIFPKYKAKEYGTTVGVEVNTKKEAKAEISMEEYHAAGLKTTVTGNMTPKERFATLSGEYRHDYMSFTGYVDYGKHNGGNIESSLVVGNQGFALGGAASYAFGNESEVKKLESVASYSTSDFDIAAFARHTAPNEKVKEEKNTMGLSFYHKFNPSWTVGAEATFDSIPPDSTPTLKFGSQYKIAEESIFKSRVDTDGKLALSFAQRYNRNTKFTVGATFDTRNFGGKNSSSYGFGIALND